MEIKKNTEKRAYAVKIALEEAGQEVGRAYLYVLYNDLHSEPFGFLEDLFVVEEFRSQGVGRQLIEASVEEAKVQGCYKLICTSREGRDSLHEWYGKLGFKDYGKEFRMDLN